MKLTSEDIAHVSKEKESAWIPCELEVIEVYRHDINALIDALTFVQMQIEATYKVDEVQS